MYVILLPPWNVSNDLEAQMRLSNSVHEAHAWRIHEIAPDFRLEDAWVLPVKGAIEDFTRLLEVIGLAGSLQGRLERDACAVQDSLARRRTARLG